MGLKKKEEQTHALPKFLLKVTQKDIIKNRNSQKTKKESGKGYCKKKKIFLKGWKADNQIISNSADPRELNSKPMDGKTEIALFCTTELS